MSNVMIRDSDHSLDIGTLRLAGAEDTDLAYALHAMSRDTDWGKPTPAIAIINSLLGDGELVSLTRYGNREGAKIGIRLRAKDGASLAEAEAALAAETEKRNTLRWKSPDPFAPPTVFDVVTSHLEHVFNPEEELRRTRFYILHLVLEAFPRSEDELVIEPEGSGVAPSGAPPVVENISTCSSLTGWNAKTGTGVDALTLNSGHLYLRGNVGWDLWMRYDTGAVQTWSDTPLVVVDWTTSGSNDTSETLRCYTAGAHTEQQLTLVSTGASPAPYGPSWRRSVFALGPYADSTRYLKFYKANERTGPEGGRWALWLNNVDVTDGSAPTDGTTRQMFRSMSIQGSARSRGAIDLRHEDPLGDVLVWSGPAECSPPLRQWRITGGSVTADAACVSGAREEITSAFTADVPLQTLPEGVYHVMARLSHTTTPGTYLVNITAQTRLSDAAPGDTPVGATQTITGARAAVGTGSDRRIVDLGELHLPVTTVGGGTPGVARITIQANDLILDEAWLFNATDGSLTWVEDAGNVVQILPASVEDPRRRVFTGSTDALLYDAGAQVQSRDPHEFKPGEWAALSVTTAVEDAAMTASYYPRWIANAGRVEI